jgi:hypothetical protein
MDEGGSMMWKGRKIPRLLQQEFQCRRMSSPGFGGGTPVA